jgi:Skp family chaperone for outer membrane proteins
VLNVKTYFSWAICFAILVAFNPTPVNAQAQPAGSGVVVIDINYIFKNHLLFKSKMDDIKQEIETFENYLRDQRTAITQQTEQLKGMPPASTEYQQLEEQLASTHTKLQLETGRKRKDILEREGKVYYNAYQNIEQHVRDFALANGIGLVLRFSNEQMDPTKRESVLQGVNRAVVFQDRKDITAAILDQLNRRTPPAGVSRTQPPQIPGRTPTRR